jgi:hypothetical protein
VVRLSTFADIGAHFVNGTLESFDGVKIFFKQKESVSKTKRDSAFEKIQYYLFNF